MEGKIWVIQSCGEKWRYHLLRRPPRLDLSIIVGPKNLSPMERILLERRLLQVLDS